MENVTPEIGSLVFWQLLTALLLTGAALLFIFSTRSIIKTQNFGSVEKAILFIFTIIIPVVAPAIAIRIIHKRDNREA